jgi:hypothetical protein
MHRLDADAASTATAQQGLLARLEEMIRRRVVDLLERTEREGRRR